MLPIEMGRLNKPKGGIMSRKFEIGFITNPEISEEDTAKINDSIVKMIEKAKGTVENVDEWGRRRMAYSIKKHNEGIYTFISADMDGSIISEIERRLRLNEKVLRFVSLRLDEKLEKSNRLIKRWNRVDKFTRKSKPAERVEQPERKVKEEEKTDE